jgi:RNA polymerase sigma-70 factor (ECF subfamily)
MDASHRFHARRADYPRSADGGRSDRRRIPRRLAPGLDIYSGGRVRRGLDHEPSSLESDRIRFEQRKKRAPGSLAEPFEGSEEPDQHHAATAREEECLLRDALAALSQDERRAIETAFFSELTYVETASELNEPVGTVKTRIRSGLAKLRRALAGKGIR